MILLLFIIYLAQDFVPLNMLHSFDGSTVNILAVVGKVLGLQVVTTRAGKEIEKQSVVLCDREHPHGILLVLYV